MSERDQWLEQHPELEVWMATIDHELDPTPTIEQRLHALQIEPPVMSTTSGLEL